MQVIDTAFEAALTAGDTVSIQPADVETSTVATASLTNGAFSGSVETPVVAANTVTVMFTATGGETEAIVYNTVTIADLGLTGTTAVKYTLNGLSTATEVQFEAALTSIIGGAFTGEISVAKVGTDIVWTLTTTAAS